MSLSFKARFNHQCLCSSQFTAENPSLWSEFIKANNGGVHTRSVACNPCTSVKLFGSDNACGCQNPPIYCASIDLPALSGCSFNTALSGRKSFDIPAMTLTAYFYGMPIVLGYLGTAGYPSNSAQEGYKYGLIGTYDSQTWYWGVTLDCGGLSAPGYTIKWEAFIAPGGIVSQNVSGRLYLQNFKCHDEVALVAFNGTVDPHYDPINNPVIHPCTYGPSPPCAYAFNAGGFSMPTGFVFEPYYYMNFNYDLSCIPDLGT